jgi:cyclopropane fatty-acyl-phospholipid synthase-like methyltransferase
MNGKNSIENNRRIWDRDYQWPDDGDEWNGQAAFCGQSYVAWKDALVQEFLTPRLKPDATLLEIGPGHGRWSGFIAGHCRKFYLADLSTTCLDHCRGLFGDEGMAYIPTDGHSLARVPDAEVDYLWSYDCFVHIGPQDTAGYLDDMQRVLKPGGEAVIHHAGRNHRLLAIDGMRQFGPVALRIYNRFSVGEWTTTDGWRSAMSKERFAHLAGQAGLEVVRQQQEFGPGNAFAVRRFGDWITTLQRPA